MREFHPAARIALAQFVIIVLGLAADFIAMAVSTSDDWHPWTLLVRYGFIPPLVWLWTAIRRENQPDSGWSERTTLLSGLALAALLVLLFLLTAGVPADQGRVYPMRG